MRKLLESIASRIIAEADGLGEYVRTVELLRRARIHDDASVDVGVFILGLGVLLLFALLAADALETEGAHYLLQVSSKR